MDTCTHYLTMIFPIFLQHGSLNLHPRMGSNKKFCFSCLVLCLSHWSFSKIITTGFILKALMLIIFTNFDFPSCSKLVLNSIALFTFFLMSHWLNLDKIISLNLITSAIMLTILDVSDIWFSRAVKTSKGFGQNTQEILSSIQDPFCWLEVLFCHHPKLPLVPKEAAVQDTT